MTRLFFMLGQIWNERNPRERKMLLVMVVIVSVGLAAVFFEWQRSAHERLNKQVPLAQAQLESMRVQAIELARLKSLPQKTAQDISQIVALLRASAQSRQLNISIQQDQDSIQLKAQQISIESVLFWLAEIQAAHQMKVTALQVKGQEGAGEMQATLELQP